MHSSGDDGLTLHIGVSQYAVDMFLYAVYAALILMLIQAVI